MPSYSYKIVTQDNRLKGGVISASSKKSARKKLERDGSAAVLIFRERNSFFSRDIALPSFRISKYERILFFRNLATMLSAGVSLSQALRVFEEQARKKNIRKMMVSMASEVENGRPLSSAMRKYPRYFSDFLVETVAVGELTGELSSTLDKVSLDLEKDYELTRKVTSAMAYPVVIVIVMVAVVASLLIYVLPQISDLFKELNLPLPLPTRILLAIGSFFGTYPWVAPLSAVLFSLLFYAARRWHKSRYYMHLILLKLPIFGEIIKEFNLARFFRSLGSLVVSGVSLVRAVEVSQKTLKNDVYKKALIAAGPVLLHGGKFTEALKPHPFLFSPQTRHIVDVGERTGKFDEIFIKIAGHFERTLQYKLQMMTSLLEPALMVMIGLIVGGIAVSIFLPIYQSSSAF